MPVADPTLGPYVLPPLKFSYDACEPFIDAETMRLHHEIHQGYVDRLNAALARHPGSMGRTIEDLLRGVSGLPDSLQDAVREQGGGHANHQFFWKILKPGGTLAGPQGRLKAAMEREWGSFEGFKAAFEAAGTAHFGSGWAFLVARPQRDFRLEILTHPN